MQQLAVCYLPHGYWFYVSGVIPEGKKAHDVDEKLIAKYGIDVSKFVRARKKVAGGANLQYLRFDRFFVLVATRGVHSFFSPVDRGGEGALIRDCREEPIKFASYAISFRGGHAHVRIERETYRELLAYFCDLATRRSKAALESALGNLPFEPYAPVRRQLLTILRHVNRRRAAGSFELLSMSCLRLRRRPVKPFQASQETTQPQACDSQP